jgi:hypothetical protein
MTNENLAKAQLKDFAIKLPHKDPFWVFGLLIVFEKYKGNSELFLNALFDSGFSDEEIREAMNGDDGVFAMFNYFKSKPELYPLK